jgi:hypothetical protein
LRRVVVRIGIRNSVMMKVELSLISLILLVRFLSMMVLVIMGKGIVWIR